MEIALGILIICGMIILYLNALATMAAWADPTLGKVQKVAQVLLVWFLPIVGSCLVLRLCFSIYPNSKLRSKVPFGFRSLILGRSKMRNSPSDIFEEEIYGRGTLNKDGYIGRNSRELDRDLEIDD